MALTPKRSEERRWKKREGRDGEGASKWSMPRSPETLAPPLMKPYRRVHYFLRFLYCLAVVLFPRFSWIRINFIPVVYKLTVGRFTRTHWSRCTDVIADWSWIQIAQLCESRARWCAEPSAKIRPRNSSRSTLDTGRACFSVSLIVDCYLGQLHPVTLTRQTSQPCRDTLVSLVILNRCDSVYIVSQKHTSLSITTYNFESSFTCNFFSNFCTYSS